eukprot:4145994-Pyramimonas_sp.AAC.1
MSWEGYSQPVLQAVDVTDSQLMTLLQPHGNRYPATEAEFNSPTTKLRRAGHTMERASNNIASALRH